MQWYYSRDGRQEGPVDEPELYRLAASGQLSPDDYVWNETMGAEWARASAVRGLFASPPRPAAPPPGAAAAGERVALSCTAPVGAAMQRMKAILFRPFDLGKWFTLGVSAWLATLGENGGSFSSVGDLPGKRGRTQGMDWKDAVEPIRTFFRHHGGTVLLVVAAVVLIGVVISLLVLWLRARGKFMLLDNVVHNRAETGVPWRTFAQHGNSLFRWYIGFALVCLAVFGLLAAIALAAVILPCARANAFVPAVLPGIVMLVLFWLAVATVLGYVSRFTEDFVVPLMYKFDLTATEAWRRFLPLLKANTGALVLYGIFYVLLSLAAGICALIFAVATCCIGGCLMAIPYVGAVVLLPITVFFRAYSIEYLAQFGPDYALFDAAGRG